MDDETTTGSRESVADGKRVESADPLLRRMRQVIERGKAASREREARQNDEARRDTAVDDAGVREQAIAADDAFIDSVRHSKPIAARLEAVMHHLTELERNGAFVTRALKPGNEFPTLITRLPIFRPTRRITQVQLQDRDNALGFDTAFGSGKRWGAPLTVRDEDTLMALFRLRTRRLYGKPAELPNGSAELATGGADERVAVHAVVCSVDQLQRELGLTHGGTNFAATVESVKRLGASRLELNLKSHDRYLGTLERGRMISLIEVQWELHETYGLLVVLIPPVMARWLEQEYTYLDWNIRRQLTPLGKALHRFLSSQPAHYRSDVQRIATAIGCDDPQKNLRPRFRSALDQLVALGWLDRYAFVGTGRRTPLELVTDRDPPADGAEGSEEPPQDLVS